MSGASDRHPGRRPVGPASQHFGVGGEPSPLVGALRGLAKIGAATAALVAASAAIAAAVALLY